MAWNVFKLPATALVSGANTLAVEIHQSTAASSDPGLDLRLLGLRQSAVTFIDRQAVQFGSDKTTASIAGPPADLDRDGIVTLLEYALGSNPRQSSPGDLPASDNASGRLALGFCCNAFATDLSLTALAADSPAGPWTDPAMRAIGYPFSAVVPGATIVESTTGGIRSVEVRDLYLLTDPAHPRRFMRLYVSAPCAGHLRGGESSLLQTLRGRKNFPPCRGLRYFHGNT